MAGPYLDSAGNVNSSYSADIQNLVFAFRQNAAVGNAGTLSALQAAATQVTTTDGVTGLTSSAVTDV